MNPSMQDNPDNDLPQRIVAAAMEVHNKLGPGNKEEVYEKALAIELQQQGISFMRQHPVELERHNNSGATFYLDLFVQDQVAVEIKAFSHTLTNAERAQMVNAIKAARSPVGLLFNFGRRMLEYRRVSQDSVFE
jgi:GxxExxY protein